MVYDDTSLHNIMVTFPIGLLRLGLVAPLERCFGLALLGLTFLCLFALRPSDMVILKVMESWRKEHPLATPSQNQNLRLWTNLLKEESLSNKAFLDSTTGISPSIRLHAKGPNHLGCVIGDVLMLSIGGFKFEGLGSIPITPKAWWNDESASSVPNARYYN